MLSQVRRVGGAVPASRRRLSTYLKFAARASQGPTIVAVAALLGLDGGSRIEEAAIAVGACSATAARLSGVEAALGGRPIDPSLMDAVKVAPITELSPIDDVRGSAAYRLEAAREIAARAVCLAAGLTFESMAA